MKPMKTSYFPIIALSAVIVVIIMAGLLLSDAALVVDFASKKQAPSLSHPFGTDAYGRDVLLRTLSGLSKSLLLGIAASVVSGILALVMGIIAGTAPKWVDNAINFIIDAIMSIPHLVLLILISFCLGKGLFGVVMGIICTHWTSLARVIRGEVLQLKEQQYIKIAQKLGQSPWTIAKTHLLPHIFPQFIVGIVLLFPHAILHESAITFLGFGLPPESPTIGIMLAESMDYVLSKLWWLFLPGVCLVAVVIVFDRLGKQLKARFDYDNMRG
ncbi:ABC transporter permease [Bengtsoniella intestinalis]|uniref:ABC transporter permease n=1 Tax=Bengtsoniella intestinalis TaxID=3073143 RepID=UPI00391EE785